MPIDESNKWGDGNYSVPLNDAPFGKWSMVMIVLHTSGDPKDMKNRVGALQAPISLKGFHYEFSEPLHSILWFMQLWRPFLYQGRP